MLATLPPPPTVCPAWPMRMMESSTRWNWRKTLFPGEPQLWSLLSAGSPGSWPMEFYSPSQLNFINGRSESGTQWGSWLEGAVGEAGGLSGLEIDWINGVAADQGATKVIGNGGDGAQKMKVEGLPLCGTWSITRNENSPYFFQDQSSRSCRPR